MKKILLLVVLVFGLGNVLFAQNTKEINLSSNKQTVDSASKFKFKLIAVEDSRCPADVNCVWAGNAKIKISLAKGKSAAKMFELNSGLEPRSIVFEGYEIMIKDISPTKKSNDPNPVKYSVKLILTKMPKSM